MELPKEPYNDPDAQKSRNKWFYDDLRKFLIEREDKLGCKTWKYILNESGQGIDVIDKEGERITTLISDQFGFSRPTSDKYKHPYDIYLSKNLDNRENAINQVCEWIYYSRTIGGSFLWPKEIWNDYNDLRGGHKFSKEMSDDTYEKSPSTKQGKGFHSYHLEDRVDLTLLEIYLFYNRNKNVELNRCWTHAKLSIIGEDVLCKWFEHFRSFEKYVDFFRFNSFVYNNESDKEYKPRNIITGKCMISLDPKSRCNGRLMIGEGDTYENINNEMFENLITWIKDRSWNIENHSDMYEKHFEK